MPSYRKSEARDWAKQHLLGVANVVIPSFSADLTRLNEKGIRHDIRRELELGFAGTLLVSEVAMSIDEYGQFFEWANDELKGRLMLIHHASFNTFEDNKLAVRHAERNGAELVLLSYPPNFWPKSAQDIFDYTKAICDATDLAILLFPMNLWGFSRIHPSDIEAAVIRRLLDSCPNIVAIKAEGGFPGIMGFVECYRLFGREVVVTCPIVHDMVPLAQLAPIQFTGTSNTEYYGSDGPAHFRSPAEARIRRSDAAVLADLSGIPRQRHRIVASRAFHSPHVLEISGLAQRVQWRPAAPADHAHSRAADGDTAPRAYQIRFEPDGIAQ